MSEAAPPPEDLPPPSAELVLYRVHVEALIATLGRRKAEKYLRTASEIFATEQSLSAVLMFRPMAQQEPLMRARRAAAYWFKQALPTFIARIPPK